jgi:hypothetical protein
MNRYTLWALVGMTLAGCGSDATSTGTGTLTLLVEATVEEDNGNGRFRVSIKKNGADVPGAYVTLDSDLGTVTLTTTGGGIYDGTQAGWADGYTLYVASGADSLEASIDAPDEARVTSPEPTIAFDPHVAGDGLVRVAWTGDLATRFELKTKDFNYGPTLDPGALTIPASTFVEETQDIEIKRENSVLLAGGVSGSKLTAKRDDRTTVIVSNPF